MQFFRHESDADVQEDLFDVGSSQRRLKEGQNNLQNSRKIHPDQRRTTGQSRLQQTDRTLHLHVQLRQSKRDRDAAQWFVHTDERISGGLRYRMTSHLLQTLADARLFLQLVLHHLLLLAGQLDLLFDAFLLLDLLQGKHQGELIQYKTEHCTTYSIPQCNVLVSFPV